ncbi:hypothetical protein IAT40_005765 [Kwoniella sp. CBS 6097]
MSWKTTQGILTSGPPSSSLPSTSSLPVGQRIRPNSNLQTPYQRETAFTRHYGVDKDALAAEERSRKSEWDVVKEYHRFVRAGQDKGADAGGDTWEERVARSYESKLFKEFALIDLKHYKSKRFALRWRTAPEVISGIGESTCASLRCRHHRPPAPTPDPLPSNGTGPAPLTASNLRFRDPDIDAESSVPSSARRSATAVEGDESESVEEMPPLRSFELPFVYAEAGERKETLVKVRLCPGCQRKLTWKPESKSTEKLKSTIGSSHREGVMDDRREKKKDRLDREHNRRRSNGKGKERYSSDEESESATGDEDERYDQHKRSGEHRREERDDGRRHHRDRSDRHRADGRLEDRTRRKDKDRIWNEQGDRDKHRLEERRENHASGRSEREQSPRRREDRRYV